MDGEPSGPSNPDEPLFRESATPGGIRALLVAGGVGVVALVVGIVTGQAIVGAIGLTILVFSLVLPLNELYGSISLTGQHLRVGRQRIDLATIDPAFGINRGEDVLDDATLASLDDRTEAVRQRSRRGDLQILGGGWGLPMTGASWLVLRQVDGTRCAVAVRRRDQLMAALGGAIGAT